MLNLNQTQRIVWKALTTSFSFCPSGHVTGFAQELSLKVVLSEHWGWIQLPPALLFGSRAQVSSLWSQEDFSSVPQPARSSWDIVPAPVLLRSLSGCWWPRWGCCFQLVLPKATTSRFAAIAWIHPKHQASLNAKTCTLFQQRRQLHLMQQKRKIKMQFRVCLVSAYYPVVIWSFWGLSRPHNEWLS